MHKGAHTLVTGQAFLSGQERMCTKVSPKHPFLALWGSQGFSQALALSCLMCNGCLFPCTQILCCSRGSLGEAPVSAIIMLSHSTGRRRSLRAGGAGSSGCDKSAEQNHLQQTSGAPPVWSWDLLSSAALPLALFSIRVTSAAWRVSVPPGKLPKPYKTSCKLPP